MSRFQPEKPLDDFQEGVVSLRARRHLSATPFKGHGRGPYRAGNMVAVRVVEHEPEILLLQGDHETGAEIAGEHLGA